MTTKDQILSILAESTVRADAATKGPWKKCSAHDGKCSCRFIWDGSGSHPIIEAVNGKWGDDYPSLRFVDGSDGSIGVKVEAYMEQITYGEIPEEAFQANKEFVSHARADLPARDAALRVAVKALAKLDNEIHSVRDWSYPDRADASTPEGKWQIAVCGFLAGWAETVKGSIDGILEILQQP